MPPSPASPHRQGSCAAGWRSAQTPLRALRSTWIPAGPSPPRPPAFRLVSRAPRTRHLRRSLRAGLPLPMRRASQGRARRSPHARRTDHPLSGRQLRVRLQLAGRRRAREGSAARSRPAWNTIETNRFGTNEFLAWCKAAGAEPLLAVNLGTGTPEKAAALVEYCNVPGGTRWSDLRRRTASPRRTA